MDPPPSAATPSPASGCWSQVVLKEAPPESEPISSRVFGSCKSSGGISVAVVDANAIIHGDRLVGTADRFVTVDEVLDEVRDPVSRQRLAFFPIHVETMDPSPDFIKKVVRFARETGDLQTLSDVDLKVIALAYMLEAQIHGTTHLREKPPPLHKVNVKNLPEAEMPGWGSNVPNLDEWEVLENAVEVQDENNASRILPLKDISSNVVSKDGISTPIENEDGNHFPRKQRYYNRPKKEIKIEGKKMVVDGIDASKGEYGENSDDWRPAVCRSTHRSYLRRKARREMSEGSEKLSISEPGVSTYASIVENCDLLSDGGSECASALQTGEEHTSVNDDQEKNSETDNVITELGRMKLKSEFELLEEDRKPLNCGNAEGMKDSVMHEEHKAGNSCQEDTIESCNVEMDYLEITSQTDGSIDILQADESCSEQSWALRSLSESSVACITSDFAMQNVILQIGLRLLAPGGVQIRQLHKWVLKCHACNAITAEIGRIFCPKCGNGGTLRKVSVTVGENGTILADRRPRISLRGTKFSIPMPQGGREGITKNFVLREDQLPRKLLYPKAKKKNNSQDFFTADDCFTQTGDKNAPLIPPVGKAVSVFMGRRNPNDNHFSRRRH